MLCSYWRAYAAAKMETEEMYKLFLINIDSAINYLFGLEFFEGSLHNQIHKFNIGRFDNVQLTSIVGDDRVLQSIILMQCQFSQLPREIYQLVILNKALTAIDENIIPANVHQRDAILERIFKACKTNTEEGINMKYRSAIEVKNQIVRTNLIKIFFEEVMQNKEL